MIEDKNSGLYEKLLEWNREYGDGLDSTVINAWNNAQAALDQFNGSQLGVKGVLNELAIKMNDFQIATKSAAEAMEQLADAIKIKNAEENKQRPPKDYIGNSANSKSSKTKSQGFKTGGKITKDRAIMTGVDNEPDAVLIKAHTDEVVLPKDNPRRALDLMAEFINSDAPLSSIVNREFSNNPIDVASVVNPMSNLGMSNLQNYERISNVGGDTKIENVFNVQGNMDKSIIPEVEKMIDRKFHENAKRQVDTITSYGTKLNSSTRGF